MARLYKAITESMTGQEVRDMAKKVNAKGLHFDFDQKSKSLMVQVGTVHVRDGQLVKKVLINE